MVSSVTTYYPSFDNMIIALRCKNIPDFPNSQINRAQIVRVSCLEIFGVVMDQHLSWNEHIILVKKSWWSHFTLQYLQSPCPWLTILQQPINRLIFFICYSDVIVILHNRKISFSPFIVSVTDDVFNLINYGIESLWHSNKH